MMYAYGMRLRGRAPGCQPKGYIDWQDFDQRCTLSSGNRVWAILWYDKPLTEKEIFDYDLVRLEDEDK